MGTTSSLRGPYVLGYTHATIPTTKRCQAARWSQSQKSRVSSDWGLQLDPMKPKSLVIAGQLYGGEYVLGSCTHRPSSGESWGQLNSDFTSEEAEFSDQH